MAKCTPTPMQTAKLFSMTGHYNLPQCKGPTVGKAASGGTTKAKGAARASSHEFIIKVIHGQPIRQSLGRQGVWAKGGIIVLNSGHYVPGGFGELNRRKGIGSWT